MFEPILTRSSTIHRPGAGARKVRAPHQRWYTCLDFVVAELSESNHRLSAEEAGTKRWA